MDKIKSRNQNYLIPISIIISAIIISGAVVFININKKVDSATSGAVVDTVTDKNLPSVLDAPLNDKPIDIKIAKDDNIKGNFNAPITIVDFSDYQCPYCSRFHDGMNKISEEYPDEVRWVYKHFPLDSIHPYARKAAEASECAAEQEKFWEYSDALFTKQSEIDDTLFGNIAKNLDLNVEKFDQCLKSEKYASKVEKDYQDGLKAGVTGTPGSFLNGIPLGGALPYESLKSLIEEQS